MARFAGTVGGAMVRPVVGAPARAQFLVDPDRPALRPHVPEGTVTKAATRPGNDPEVAPADTRLKDRQRTSCGCAADADAPGSPYELADDVDRALPSLPCGKTEGAQPVGAGMQAGRRR